MYDFLLLGAGVIGMMLARELAHSGARVALVDKGECARESSWAGGGIVSPLYPWRYSEPVTHLAAWSQAGYQNLAQELLECTGIDPELRQKGMYMVEVEDAEGALEWARRYHRPLAQVTAEHLYQQEPNCAPGIKQALWMPEVASIRNPRLAQALKADLQRYAGITLYEHQGVKQLLIADKRVTGAELSTGCLQAATTVITAGAWSSELLSQLAITLPIEPVKGQMLLFKAPKGLVNRVILNAGRYVIPRNDGRVLVGSTLEHAGFDKTATLPAYDSLYQSALDIVPKLADYKVEHHWAGLRPGSPQGIPFIGAVPGFVGLEVNAGHYRNGLVLAPASTRMHADRLLGRTPIVDPTPYQLAGRLL